MAAHPNLDTFLGRLKNVKASGNNWTASCPAHGDAHPSLSVSIGHSGGIVVFCHAQKCTAEAIATAVGMVLLDFAPEPPGSQLSVKPRTDDESLSARIVAVYEYHDEDGNLLYQSVRLRDPKDFRQRRPAGWKLNELNQTVPTFKWDMKGVRRVPYRLPQLLAAPPEAWLIVVEGEKDVDNLVLQNLYATTNAQGAGKWHTVDPKAVEAAFRGRRVAIIPDHDKVGTNHVIQVASALAALAAEIRVVELPGLVSHGDVSDWLEGLQ